MEARFLHTPAIAPTVRSGDTATEQTCQANGAYLGGVLPQDGKVAALGAFFCGKPLPNGWQIKCAFRQFHARRCATRFFSDSPGDPDVSLLSGEWAGVDSNH